MANLLTGVHEHSFITIMDDDEEDPFVDVTIHVEPLFVNSSFPHAIRLDPHRLT